MSAESDSRAVGPNFPPEPNPAEPKALWRNFVQRALGIAWPTQADAILADDVFGYFLSAWYSEPTRAYHTMDHIMWCLELLREFFPAAKPRPDWYLRAELALWFHDVIYDPKRKDNEHRSARVLLGVGALLGLNEQLVDGAAQDIEATTHNPRDNGIGLGHGMSEARKWVLDIDLASLGFEPDKFAKNSTQIRHEFSWVPEDAYRAGRKAALQGFLDRTRIYYTDECHERFEHQARANLQKAIRELG